MQLLDFCTLNGLVAGNGHVLDYILVNWHFCSSVLDTRVFCKSYLEGDHCLLVSRLSLKLKVRRKRTQQYHWHQVDTQFLNDQQICEFMSALADKLADSPKRQPDICTELPDVYLREGRGVRLGD